jgi:putative transcriptional regulator
MPQNKDSDLENFNLTGKILLAMPNLGDQRFHKSIILICAHDTNGAMGLVINTKMPDVEFVDLLTELKITSDITLDLKKFTVMQGGPVDMARGFLLHDAAFSCEGTIPVGQEFAVSGSVDAIRGLAQGTGPSDALFMLGYSGWGAGQLEAELQNNAWIVTDPNSDIIFSAEPEDKWNLAFDDLGFDPAMLSATAGRA